jgi:hypothetical protein
MRSTGPRLTSGTVPVVDLTQAAAWHREAAALVAAAHRAGVGTAQLPAVQQRMLQQRARLAEAVAAAGPPAPALEPTPGDIAAAMPALGDLSPAAVGAALAAAEATLDAADSVLTADRRPVAQPAAVARPLAPPPATAGTAAVPRSGRRNITTWPPGTRNAIIYGGYAAAVLVTQFVLFTVFNEEQLPLLAPCCLVVLPAFSWAAGYATVGIAFAGGRDGPKVNRTPRVGLLVNLIPDVLLVAILGVLFVARQL